MDMVHSSWETVIEPHQRRPAINSEGETSHKEADQSIHEVIHDCSLLLYSSFPISRSREIFFEQLNRLVQSNLRVYVIQDNIRFAFILRAFDKSELIFLYEPTHIFRRGFSASGANSTPFLSSRSTCSAGLGALASPPAQTSSLHRAPRSKLFTLLTNVYWSNAWLTKLSSDL